MIIYENRYLLAERVNQHMTILREIAMSTVEVTAGTDADCTDLESPRIDMLAMRGQLGSEWN